MSTETKTTNSKMRLIGMLAVMAILAALVWNDQRSGAAVGKTTPPARTVAKPVAAAPSQATPSDPAAPVAILEIRPRTALAKLTGDTNELFAPHNWNPPPPPPPPAPPASKVKPLPPPKPVAPPLPFAVLGKKLDDGAWEIFLGNQDRIYVVKVNDTIDGLYRVESVSPPTMTFVYLHAQKLLYDDKGLSRSSVVT